jgi:SAM-dependent methyltransferase
MSRRTVRPSPWAPHVAALRAFLLEGDREAGLVVRDDRGSEDVLPAAYYFRSMEGREDDPLAELEGVALGACGGRVLDVGAGAGSHTLALQAAGLEVTALEPHEGLQEVLLTRGVTDPRTSSLEELAAAGERYDTLLLLMNGLGLAGTLDGLPGFLQELAGVLAPGGQVLADSSDLRELVDDADAELRLPDGRYLGDLQYQLEFRGERGEPFPFLFVDPDTLSRVAGAEGWQVEVLAVNGDAGYLCRLTRPGDPGPSTRIPGAR